MLLEEKYIFLNVDVKDKSELLFFIANQAKDLSIGHDADKILHDLNKREAEFPTGLQDGFAIPHTRSKYIDKPSILYITTKQAIEWGSLDDKRVNCIFSLLVPEKNEGNIHLKMLSKLATCLLEEDFKENIKAITDKQVLKDYIYKKMEEE